MNKKIECLNCGEMITFHYDEQIISCATCWKEYEVKYCEIIEDFELEKVPNLLPEKMVKEIEENGKAQMENGSSVEIDRGLPYVAINLQDDEYFFQGDEANRLLEDIPDNVNEECFLLWSTINW